MRPNQDVVNILPNNSGAMEMGIFRENLSHASKARIKQASSQVAALYLGRAFGHQFDEFVQLTPNRFELDDFQPSHPVELA